jgi:hypothetical protein
MFANTGVFLQSMLFLLFKSYMHTYIDNTTKCALYRNYDITMLFKSAMVGRVNLDMKPKADFLVDWSADGLVTTAGGGSLSSTGGSVSSSDPASVTAAAAPPLVLSLFALSPFFAVAAAFTSAHSELEPDKNTFTAW